MLLYDLENRRIICAAYVDWDKDVQPVYKKEVAANYESVRDYVPNDHQIEYMLRKIGDDYDLNNIDAVIHKVVVDFIQNIHRWQQVIPLD